MIFWGTWDLWQFWMIKGLEYVQNISSCSGLQKPCHKRKLRQNLAFGQFCHSNLVCLSFLWWPVFFEGTWEYILHIFRAREFTQTYLEAIWNHSVRFCFFFSQGWNFNCLIYRYEKLLSVKADLDPFRFGASPNLLKKQIETQIETLTDYGIARYWLQS